MITTSMRRNGPLGRIRGRDDPIPIASINWCNIFSIWVACVDAREPTSYVNCKGVAIGTSCLQHELQGGAEVDLLRIIAYMRPYDAVREFALAREQRNSVVEIPPDG